MSAHIVMGMGFGDEGKGVMTNFLVHHHNAPWVVRYNGGPQCGHNVIHDGMHHNFSQFGSGTFQGAHTYLSKRMLMNPISLIHEAASLSDTMHMHITEILERVMIDPRCPVITPFHVFANRLREKKLRHGSCGKGVGELSSDIAKGEKIITVGQLSSPSLVKMLEVIRKRKINELRKDGISLKGPEGDALVNSNIAEELASAYKKFLPFLNIPEDPDDAIQAILSLNVVLEGAQGLLLDEDHGFYPHTTWSKITPEWAVEFLDEAGYIEQREWIGVTRPYQTRHGNGPMMPGIDLRHFYDEHNITNDWQGDFRYGFTDGCMLAYAAECARHYGGLDCIAVTHTDILETQPMFNTISNYEDGSGKFSFKFDPNRGLNEMEKLGERLKHATPITGVAIADEVFDYISEKTGVPIEYMSNGPRTGCQFMC